MSVFLGLIVLVLAVAVFWRLSARALAWTVGGIIMALALGILMLNLNPHFSAKVAHPERSTSSLMIACMVFFASLVPTSVALRARKGRPAKNLSKQNGEKTIAKVPTIVNPFKAKAGKNAGKGNGGIKVSDDQPLNDYELMGKVGIGGMATVFRARRKSDNKAVALKIPQEKFVADAKFVRRFHREAEVLMRLNHNNIVKVFEHASEGTTHYISMELIEGDALENLIEGRRLALGHSVEIMKHTADALRYIHKQGIIHRDIKPGNIMVEKNAIINDPEPRIEPDGVKLMDFGIAAGKVLTRLTMTGARVGTPVYMSPEQARGLKIDHRSDIYSLGLVFYEMVTGATAFKGGYEAVVHQQIFQTPTPPRQVNLEVPQKLNDLIMKMIEKDPDKRPNLTEVIDAVDAGLFEEKTILDGPGQLVVSVNTKRGLVRLMDFVGNLDRSFGVLGPGGQDKIAAVPTALTCDKNLNVYALVMDFKNGELQPNLIRKFTGDGTELLAYGSHGMKPGEFINPIGLAANPFEQVYVLDADTCLISRFDGDGNFMGRFGGRGAGRGSFEDPRAIVAGHDHFLYVLDYGNRQVQRLSLDGQFLNKYSFRLRQDSEELRVLDGIGVDKQGVLYVSDAASRKIRTIRPDGRQGTSFALEAIQGEDMNAILSIGADHEGNVYALRRGAQVIRKFAADGTFVGQIDAYAPVLAFNVFVREPILA